MLASMVGGAEHQHLNIERIAEIRHAVDLPMTLHGGSGTSDEDFRRAIQAGITMIHISTELRIAWRKGMEDALRNSQAIAPYKVLPEAVDEVKEVVLERLRLFNADGRDPHGSMRGGSAGSASSHSR